MFEEPAVQDARPVTLETESFLGVLPGPRESSVAELSGVVGEVPVDAWVQPVPNLVARRRFGGGGRVVAGEVMPGCESVDVAGVANDQRSGDRTETNDVGE